MRKTFLLLALSALLAATAHAATVIDGIPVPEELMQLARKVVAGNSPKDALLRSDNPFRGHPFFQQLVGRLDFNRINEEAAKYMVQTFTRDEMHALLRFQESPEGKSITAKMPGYQQMVGGIIQNELKGAMEAYLITQGARGAQSPDVQAPVKEKPVVPWTPPTSAPGTGSPIGQ